MFVHLLGKRGPGAAVVVGGGSGDSDGGFVEPPVASTTASGNTTISGKVKPGSFGKFVYPMAAIAAGRQYTFRTVANFAQLAQQGKLAMVGFGFKNGNDFHIAGLRGDGSTGCTVYEVYGTAPNGWNKQTGHSVIDSGAPAHGTQYTAYHRMTTSADGTSADYATSDDGVTWVEELSDFSLTPFTNVSGVVTFGIALWFNNADAGPFSIVIDQFADAAAPDPFFANVVLLLGFEGADGATATTDESPSGHAVTFNGNAQIDTAQKPFGTSSCLFDGVGDYLSMPDSPDWQLAPTATDPYTVEFMIRPHDTSTSGILAQAGGSNDGWYIENNLQKFAFTWYYNGGTTTTVGPGGTTAPVDNWHHVAVSKNADKVRLFLDGTMVASATPTHPEVFDSARNFEIGRYFGFAGFNGWLKEIRITKGVCRYDTDGSIMVPTAAFPRS